MPVLMLDANICIYVIKGHPPEVRRRLESIRPEDLAISSIVSGELWTGVAKSHQQRHNELALRDFLAFVRVLDWPAEAAKVYGQIRARLESAGRPIGALDTLIAAHAVYEGATLVTRNRSEFDRVAGLKVEAWDSL